MQAIEWWPTRDGYPRVFVTGPCSYCGNNTTREDQPYRHTRGPLAGNVDPIYCTKSHQERARRARKQTQKPAPTCGVKSCTGEPNMKHPNYNDTTAYCDTHYYRYNEKNFPPKTSKDKAEGMREQVRLLSIAIAKRWKKGALDDAKRLLNTLPKEWRDECLRQASTLIDPQPQKAKKQHPQHPKQDTQQLKGVPITIPRLKPLTHDQQIANYRAYRATVSKSAKPILQESIRRSICKRPDKIAYENTPVGREAADWHLTELRNIDGRYANVYADCPCGFLHVGGGSR